MSKIKFLVEIDSKYATVESIKASLASQFINVEYVDFSDGTCNDDETIGTAQERFIRQTTELLKHKEYWLELVELHSENVIRVNSKTGKSYKKYYKYLSALKAKEFIQRIFKVLQHVSEHEGIAHELRVIPQDEPSLSELLEENKKLKDSIEKYRQIITQILFILKTQSERNGETQTV